MDADFNKVIKPPEDGTPTTPDSTALPRDLLVGLLNFFYPIRYGMSMDLETSMLGSRVSRQQAAIIWVIESETETNCTGWVRRRLIEQRLRDWFETSNSHVSQMLKALSRPPLSLIVQMENPDSGREKLVALTPGGKAFFQEMMNTGIEYLMRRLPHLTLEMAQSGIDLSAAITSRC